MTDILLIAVLVLVAAVLVCQLILLLRRPPQDAAALAARLEALGTAVATIEKGQERGERALREELAQSRELAGREAATTRQELAAALKGGQDSTLKTLAELSALQKSQLEAFAAQLGKLTESNQQRIDALKLAVEQKLTALSESNAAKLEEMRATVNEKLQSTLERRLSESFKIVGDRLDQVHKGLGEMQTLAEGVGDLKRVLTNVKTRGTWGEVQLGLLLEQVLTPDQFDRNVATREDSGERVEFAIRLPGRDDGEAPGGGKPVWLPIDAKFPKEDYERLVDAADRSDSAAVEEAAQQLAQRVERFARDISEKYINPPGTTDFAILFLPTEGLYAEVLRRPGLADRIQRDWRVTIAGPTTLTALLNSLQMGFRTLAIQRRSSEVWTLLSAVKTEFGKFGEVIAKVKSRLDQAANEIDKVGTRTRAIERKLRRVEELPETEAQKLLRAAAQEELLDLEGEAAEEE